MYGAHGRQPGRALLVTAWVSMDGPLEIAWHSMRVRLIAKAGLLI